jgi:hypothetical protein
MDGSISTAPAAERKTTPSGKTVDDRELLLQAMRRALGTAVDAEPSDLTHANWPRLLSLAQEHHVVTLLNKGLQRSEGVPPPVRRWMENYCRTSVSHNLSLASELFDVIDVLEASGIEVAPFKGPAWAKILYGNLADREIADLDLFVDQLELERVAKILRDSGYISVPPDAVVLDTSKDIEFVHVETAIHIEVHWSACEPWLDSRLALLKLWTPQSTTVLLNRNVPVPSPENMLFLLAIHGFRDGWESLKWVCDIAKMLQVFPNLDFAAILRTTDKLSRRRVILVPLALAQRLFNLELPVLAADAIARDGIVSEIAAQIARRFYSAEADHLESGPYTASGRIYLEWYRVQMCDSVWERLGWHTKFLVKLLEPNEHDCAPFGGKLPQGAYWLVRPWRLLRSFGFSGTLRLARQFLSRCIPQGLRNSS